MLNTVVSILVMEYNWILILWITVIAILNLSTKDLIKDLHNTSKSTLLIPALFCMTEGLYTI